MEIDPFDHIFTDDSGTGFQVSMERCDNKNDIQIQSTERTTYPLGTYLSLLKDAQKKWDNLRNTLGNYQKDKYSFCADGCLAVVALPYDGTASHRPNRDVLYALSVSIVKIGDEFYLQTETNTSLHDRKERSRGQDVSVLMSMKKYHPRLKDLFDYFVSKSISIYLIGVPNSSPYDFVVTDIYMRPTGRHNGIEYVETDPQQPLFQLTLMDLLTEHTEDVSKTLFSHEFTSIADYALISNFFSSYYPKEVNYAIRRNLNIVTGPSSTSDEQKQAKQALRIITNIDWREKPLNIPDLQQVRKALDAEFFGLEFAKEQLLESMAIIKASAKMPHWGILLQGPAGTGKTALATLVSKFFGCPYTQVDMNSVADRVALVGSSRLYDNGTIGLLVKKFYEVRSSTQVMIINELDKANQSNCSDALLSFLDHYSFRDSFIEDALPTENVFFIATANDISNISAPLLDRFIVINVAPYSAEDKKEIFEHYTLPRMLQVQGLNKDTISLSENAALTIYERYFSEPGVRDLERFALRLIGHYRLTDSCTAKVYSEDEILTLLGNNGTPHRVIPQCPGIVWTAIKHNNIAQLIPVETAVKKGTGKFEVVNITSRMAVDYATSAYKCLQYTTAIDLSGLDIAVSIPQIVPELFCNSIGMAVFASILSAITETTAFVDTAFIGGCDLLGNTYLDDTDISLYLNCFYAKDLKTIYMPYDTHGLIAAGSYDGVRLIEAINIKALMTFAGSIDARQ